MFTNIALSIATSQTNKTNHLTQNTEKPCGIYFARQKRIRNKAIRDKRNKEIMMSDIKTLNPMKNNMGKSGTRQRGKPITIKEKDIFVRIFDEKKQNFWNQKILYRRP